jgi:hypothetical protein
MFSLPKTKQEETAHAITVLPPFSAGLDTLT